MSSAIHHHNMLDVLAFSALLSSSEFKKGPNKSSFRTCDDTAEIQSLHSPKRPDKRKVAPAAGGPALKGSPPPIPDGASTPVRMHYQPEYHSVEDGAIRMHHYQPVSYSLEDDAMNTPKSPTSVLSSSNSCIFRRSHCNCFQKVQPLYTMNLSLSLDDEMEHFGCEQDIEELIGLQFYPDDTMDYSSSSEDDDDDDDDV